MSDFKDRLADAVAEAGGVAIFDKCEKHANHVVVGCVACGTEAILDELAKARAQIAQLMADNERLMGLISDAGHSGGGA